LIFKQVGVHNGYCYVQKPQYVHLEPEEIVGRDRMASFGKGKRKDVSMVRWVVSRIFKNSFKPVTWPNL